MISENILNYARIVLYVVLIGIAVLMFEAWRSDHPEQSPVTMTVPSERFVPLPAAGPITQPSPVAATPSAAPPLIKSQMVNVKTDLLDINIDTYGGDIVGAALLKYAESLENKTPYVLFNEDPKTKYIAESGLLSKRGPDTSTSQAVYRAEQTNYVLLPDQKELIIKLIWEKDGILVHKLFTFKRGSYEIKVGYELLNQSGTPWNGYLYTQLMRTDTPPENGGGMMNLATYFGAAISSPQKPFEKISFDSMNKANLSREVQDGWAAMIQHYFVSAWIPPKVALSTYYSKVTSNQLYTIGMIGKELKAAPGEKVATEAKLYVGPALADQLAKAAPGLQLTIDYGWFWFISDILFWMMQAIYDVVGNWGWAIVLVTVIIKLLFYHLSNKSYRSMSAMKKLQPKIERLKERFGNDKQKLTQATLDLYRQEKVNPMSGCLPILVQIPVFIALYWVLIESVQLRQAPFIFWIKDLATHDPYYVLPVLMGISMFLQQRLNPPPPDPLQAKLMMLMPVIFTVLFANFPAGLMLYWFVNNMLSYLQQWYIMHTMEKESVKV